MDSLPTNSLDLTLIGAVILLALFGLWLGFVRSGLYVLSWIGGAITALMVFPFVRPYVHNMIDTPWMADIAGALGLFVLALALFTVCASVIGSWVRNSRLNALDRSLGMLAGIVIAATLASVAYLGVALVWPPKDHPEWVREARARPILEEGAIMVWQLIPPNWQEAVLNEAAKKDAKGKKDGKAKAGTNDTQRELIKELAANEAERMFRELLNPKPSEPTAPKTRDGYNTKERLDMERLIEGTN